MALTAPAATDKESNATGLSNTRYGCTTEGNFEMDPRILDYSIEFECW